MADTMQGLKRTHYCGEVHRGRHRQRSGSLRLGTEDTQTWAI